MGWIAIGYSFPTHRLASRSAGEKPHPVFRVNVPVFGMHPSNRSPRTHAPRTHAQLGERACPAASCLGRSETGIAYIYNVGRKGPVKSGQSEARGPLEALWSLFAAGGWRLCLGGETGPPRSRSVHGQARPLPRRAKIRPALALPHPRLMLKARSRLCPTDCAWGRKAPMAKFGCLTRSSASLVSNK